MVTTPGTSMRIDSTISTPMVAAPKMYSWLEEVEPVRVVLDDDFLVIVQKIPRVRHGVSG